MSSDYSLLIVDDEPIIQEILSSAMQDICSHIYCASDGIGALEIIAQQRIDVALIDFRMPRMSGLELLKATRDQSPNTVCIVVSGSHERDVLKECFQAGAYDFVEKPFNPDVLKQIAVRAFEKSFFQRERWSFLEYIVCIYGKTTPKEFRALDCQKGLVPNLVVISI